MNGLKGRAGGRKPVAEALHAMSFGSAEGFGFVTVLFWKCRTPKCLVEFG